MNVRSASILGYVGAGGIGLLLNEKLGWRQYDKVSTILLTLLVTVYAIETLSRAIRKKLS
jgi:phosphonate transport system permease protein